MRRSAAWREWWWWWWWWLSVSVGCWTFCHGQVAVVDVMEVHLPVLLRVSRSPAGGLPSFVHAVDQHLRVQLGMDVWRRTLGGDGEEGVGGGPGRSGYGQCARLCGEGQEGHEEGHEECAVAALAAAGEGGGVGPGAGGHAQSSRVNRRRRRHHRSVGASGAKASTCTVEVIDDDDEDDAAAGSGRVLVRKRK